MKNRNEQIPESFEEKVLHELEDRQQKLEQTKKIELEKIREKKLKENIVKTNKFTKIFLTIVLIATGCFWIFFFIDSFNYKEHIYRMISSSLLSSGIILLILSSLLSKTRKKNISSTLGGIICLGFVIFQILMHMNIITLPTQPVLINFSNKKVSTAMQWASENKVKINPTYDYSDTVKENYIMIQETKSGTLVKDIKVLDIVVSRGPNYETEINIPDMLGWNVDKVIEKLEELNYNFDKVNIVYEFSEEEKDTLTNQNLKGETRRNNNLNLTFSLGNEENLIPVKLIDLIGEKEFSATLWLKRNGIKYEIEYKFDHSVEKGKVISTDPKSGTVIDQKTMTVKIVISKGAKITAPDFSDMSLEEIIAWAEDKKVRINYASEYHEKIKLGGIIRVDKPTSLEEGSIITVVTSKGQLKMVDYKSISDLRKFANEYGITLNESQEFNDKIKEGEIISCSHKAGQVMKSGEVVDVTLSKGSVAKVPNMVGMTESSARNACSNAGLSCTVSYIYSTKTKGSVVNQNKTSGSEVIKGSNIVITVSKGLNSSGGTSSGGSGNNGGTPTKPTPTPAPVCNTTTFKLFPDLIAVQDPAGTCANIKARYPGYKFYCDYDDYSTTGYKGAVLNSPNGQTINSCNTVPIKIRRNG